MHSNKNIRVKNIEIWLIFYFAYIIFSVYISYYLNKIPPQSSELTSVVFVESNVDTPQELHFNAVTPVNLPDMSTAKKLGIIEGWYIISISPQMNLLKNQKLSLYIPLLGHNIEVFLNHQWLGSGGRMQAPIDRHINHPLIFSFDKQQFKNNGNKLYIHLKSIHPEWMYLGKVYLGADKLLRPIYDRQKILRINLIIFTTIALIFTSLFTALLWFFRRKDTYYLWYSVAELLWAAHDTNLFLKRVPFSDEVWEAFIPLSFGWSILCFVFFIHRYIENYNKKIDQFILILGVIFSIPFFLLDISENIFYGYKIWFIFILFIGGYILWFMIQNYRKTKNQNVLLLIFTTLITIFFGIHDLLAATTVLPPNSPYILYLAASLVILVISSILLRRFVDSLNIVENYNKELKWQVNKKSQQLEQEYKKIQKLQEKQILNEERERIMRDIHDGIGGQLVTTLAAIDSSEITKESIKDNLKLALQDLRLVIDSLDGDSQDITTILGTLRMRLGDLLEKANIQLIWKVQDLPLLDKFGPEKSLNIMRIIQEAITNVVKHSGASILTISTYEKEKDTKKYSVVMIADNGCGIGVDKTKGRGLSNMKSRAKRINASLKMSSLSEGVSILLIFYT